MHVCPRVSTAVSLEQLKVSEHFFLQTSVWITIEPSFYLRILKQNSQVLGQFVLTFHTYPKHCVAVTARYTRARFVPKLFRFYKDGCLLGCNAV
jgi:hypothetical protein